MRIITCLFFFITIFFNLKAQIVSPKQEKLMIEYYNLGTKALYDGDYQSADSLLELSVMIKETESNLYNYAMAKLLLGDTMVFCNQMRELILTNAEDVVLMYFSYCASCDTVYYNKERQKINERIDTGYWEVKIQDRYLPYKTVYFYDNINEGQAHIFSSGDPFNPRKTNLSAIYELHKNGDTIFTFTKSPPTFTNYSDFYDKNPNVKEAKKELGLKKVIVDLELFISKKGSIVDYNVININQSLNCINELKVYVDKIVKSMPRFIPGKFNDHYVIYKYKTFISFW